MNVSMGSHDHGRLSSVQLTRGTWPGFERLFAANGGVWGGCWCMFYHHAGKFDSGEYENNRVAKKELVIGGKAHGTIVYCGKDPVGWCQFGPQKELPRIDRKRGYSPTSANPWRITCLFVAPDHRRTGVSKLAVAASLKQMRKLGAKAVESYPVSGVKSPKHLWMGTPELFQGFGFSRIRRLVGNTWIYSIDLADRKKGG